MNALWWWIDRWRKSTAFTDMTLAEQGAYRNLLDEATLRGGALPNDERVLAKACGDTRAWGKVRAAVLARFELHKDGLHNETLDGVLHQSARRKKNQANYRARRDNGGDNGGDNEPITNSAKADNKRDNKPASPDLSVQDPIKERSDLVPPVRPPKDSAIRGRFESFWAEYPRKTAKEKAWQAWLRLTPTAELTSEMLAAVRAQRGSRQWREGVIPHASTWLNQARWTDEHDQRIPSAEPPPMPFWDECAKCGDIHPVGQPCPVKA